MNCGSFSYQPMMQRSRDQWHHSPGQQRDHARVEGNAPDEERPRLDCGTGGQAQEHCCREDAEKGSQRHFPSHRWLVWRAKPRFESMQLAIDRFALSQRSRLLLPYFEHRGVIEGVALLLVGERAEDAELARV